MTREEEKAVIQRVLAGETELFEALVKAHEKNVYSLALRMLDGNHEDAMDASQEAFFRAFRALGSFRGDSKFSVWLYRLTSNVCLDMLRKSSRLREDSLTEEEGGELAVPDVRFDPQTELERRELRQAVREGVNALPPTFRQALVLRDVNGLTYEEIAQVTGLEEGTVKSRIFRARRKLATLLMKDGNISDPEPSYTSAEKGGAADGKL